VDPTTSTTAPAESSSSSESGVDSSSTGVAEVTISGVLQDIQLAAGIGDAQISLHGVPGFETVSAADGAYALAGLTPGDEIFVKVEPSTEYLGSIVPLTVPESDDEQQLVQISNMTYDMQIEILQDMMPAMPIPGTSIIIARVQQPTATGAVIDVQPAPDADTFYAPDENGMPVLGQNVAEFSFLPVVIYFNVVAEEPSSLTITATHPERECSIVHPSFPTLPEHVTLVDVDCPSG
ncbi:MAG: hypothetical protein IAG13_37535, partial [Deltaproteobacteria bacterium]|nr:hypothetical protein [Nannocystaceae bacterium]